MQLQKWHISGVNELCHCRGTVLVCYSTMEYVYRTESVSTDPVHCTHMVHSEYAVVCCTPPHTHKVPLHAMTVCVSRQLRG